MKTKKPLLLSIVSLLVTPLTLADDCGITNLAQCIPQKLFEYLLSLINAPFQPFLALTKSLLYEAVNVSVFQPLWAIIVYIISIIKNHQSSLFNRYRLVEREILRKASAS
ncbi:MAG TPA: hypothetical protein VFF28_01975 [Candidatus Nanoarchaeia archaeon]|nr:hypothetical protein [Candidatus Nanoarchaeia archaeon]